VECECVDRALDEGFERVREKGQRRREESTVASASEHETTGTAAA
jgi:phosphosulfolactate synthase (CoM biosynthesis protein A)